MSRSDLSNVIVSASRDIRLATLPAPAPFLRPVEMLVPVSSPNMPDVLSESVPPPARAGRVHFSFSAWVRAALVFSGFTVAAMRLGAASAETVNSESAPPANRAPSPADIIQLPRTSAPSMESGLARPIYFPPNPPPLGTGIDFRRPRVQAPPGVRSPTIVSRPDLHSYETDPFYAPLSSYLDRSARFGPEPLVMDAKVSALFAGFRKSRDALLAELREKIASVENSGPAQRLSAFEAFARDQASRLAGLEDMAERLRASLARGADWYAMREWKLGKGDLRRPREETRALERQLVRAAAYYQEGLSPAQRRLLRELAMEMEETMFLREGDVPTSRFFAFFSPDNSRIRLPDDVPAPIRAQLAVYAEEKDALKKELGDAIYDLDKAMFASSRVNDLTALARSQAQRIAALEEVAEGIRRDLTHVPGFQRTRGPDTLPVELVARFFAYAKEATRAGRAREAAFNQAVKEAMDAEMENFRVAAASGQPVRDPGAMRAAKERAAAAGQDALDRYNAEHADETARNLKERDDISDEIARALGPEARIPVDSLSPAYLAEFVQSQRLAKAYREYDIAALEPGLSPEQRRLLFGAAITSLDLPQPGPERQATVAPKTIFR